MRLQETLGRRSALPSVPLLAGRCGSGLNMHGLGSDAAPWAGQEMGMVKCVQNVEV